MANSMQGEICGWHYATREPIRLRWREGRITNLDPTERPEKDVWLAPPLFDLQINGYGGEDFQQDALTADDLLTATRGLRAAGCTRFLLTLITAEWPRLTARLRHLRSLRSQSDELQSAIVGWHIEGPFLSNQPGFHGAHNPAWMCDPAPEHILELCTIVGSDPCLLTLSPERGGALQAIELAVSRGIKVSLGHTNASADTLRQAVKAGATGFTHLGNGCPRELDRHDNILWRVFETSGLMVSLIPDQIHVSPPLFRLAHRALGDDSIYYTSDAMSAAGMPPGRYKLANMELEVGPDQIVRQPGKPLFAGSALRPIDGVFRAAQMLGCPWQEVWKRFSEAPAKLMGLRNEMAVGQRAEFCAVKVTHTNELLEMQVCAGGSASDSQR
jgi:N-acetylglucosamine-6-phosphate deacetylase